MAGLLRDSSAIFFIEFNAIILTIQMVIARSIFQFGDKEYTETLPQNLGEKKRGRRL
jgi:hypothetical protein